jgi:hypothetical protein
MTHERIICNLKRDLDQRTDEYEAKVDEVIAPKRDLVAMTLDRDAWHEDHDGDCPYVKEIAALQYQVENQTLRADDAVAAIEVWKRDFAAQRERIGELEGALGEATDMLRDLDVDPDNSWNEFIERCRAALGREGSGK